ncbi:protein kinase domain-containing protein [Dokdonella sp.]|uniref:protein kinase domain-containing protein n=1 Tax=Dokdonella sp. TaxID=2291710 RepID=UPI00378429CC
MSAHRADWPRLLDLFEGVVDAPATERRRALDELASREPQLHARLLHLLDLDGSSGDFAGDVSRWRDALIAEDVVDDDVPERIGPWRIVRELGCGGMGRVHLAERADGAYEQRVALKQVRGEFTSDAAVARFVAERNILARLDHPCIAALVDGGVDDAGRPWFAMQYVDGVPLPDYCAAHASTLAQRLRLFCDICDAVAYAHRQLIVHCDLKPSNVLVDASGQPRLLDFGIARLLADEAAGTMPTQLRALTPAYAAPEQLAGEPVGIASDVYALGVMLHELLVGQRPYASTVDSAAALAVAHAKGEPPPASRTATATGPVMPRRLRGDLDLIVATALRHDPAHRYPGADALADDLRRHLAGWPLRAQRDSVRHRLRKFVARHRIAVPLALLATIALLATTSVALLQSRDARRQAERAESVRNFLLDLFRQADPDRSGERPLTARELIDAGAQRVQRGLGSDPDTRVELLGVVGNLYSSLGQVSAAADIYEARLVQAQQLYAAGDRREVLARLDLAQSESERDHFERARELAQGALAELERSGGSNDLLRADAYARLGWTEKLAGRYEQAADWQQRRIALLRIAAPGSTELAGALDSLGAVRHAQGHYDESAQAYREALQLAEAHADSPPSLLLGIRYDLALGEHEAGHFEQADLLFKRNLEFARNVYGEEHHTVADQLYQIGQNARQSGHEADSLPWLRQALAIYERLDGPRHSRVATALTTLAQAQLRSGEPSQAVTGLERAYRIYLDTLGPKHLYTAVGETALAQAKLETGDATGAEATFRDALAKYADANPDHIYVEAVRKGLGEALLAQHRPHEAEPLLRLAYAHVSAKFGGADQRSVGIAITLAKCLRAMDRAREAGELLQTTRADVERGADTPTRSRNLDKLKAALDSPGRD